MKTYSANEKNINSYQWFTFNGKTKVKLTNKSHVTFLADGTKYGIRPLRSGDESVIIFEDNLKVDFRVSSRQAVAIERKSKKTRTPRNLEQKLRAVQNKRVVTKTSDYRQQKEAWDGRRYQGDGKRLPSPKNGIDLAKFQWRKVAVPIITLSKTDKIKKQYRKNEQLGFRFDSPARGGLVVDPLGNAFRISTEMYDFVVENSKLIAKNKWLTNKLTAKDIAENKQYENAQVKERKEVQRLKDKQERDAIKAKRLALRKKQKLEKEAAKQREKEAVAEYKKAEEARVKAEQDSIKQRSKSIEPEDRLKAFLDSTLDDESIEDDHLDELELDDSGRAIKDEDPSDEDQLPETEDEDGVESDDSEETDSEEEGEEDQDSDENPEEDDDVEIEEPDLGSRDLDSEKINSEIDDALGEELDKQKSELGLDGVDDDEELDSEFADDDDEDGIIDDDEEDLSDEELDEDSDPDVDEEADSEEEDGDSETEENSVDEDEQDVANLDTEDEDEDVKAAEEADKESKKDKKSKEEKESAPKEDYVPKLADIVRFKKDTSEQREFILLEKYNPKGNTNIEAFKFYDINNQPKHYNLVLISVDKKMSIGKQVEKVRRADVEEFRDFSKMLPDLKASREAIIS